MKGLIRFALIWAISMLLTPYVERFFARLARRAPEGSIWRDVLNELSGQYATSLIRQFGETAGDLVLGSANKGRTPK